MDEFDLVAATQRWSPEQRAMLRDLLAPGGGHEVPHVQRYRNPAELLAATDPKYRITPAIKLIADEIEKTLDTPGRNLLITAPPQEGKSMLTCIGTPARALQKNPNRRCILAMYGDALAHEHGGRCRDLFTNHGTGATDPITGRPMDDLIGLALDPSYGSAGRWRVKGHDGGLVSAGIGAGITGRPADLFIMDDPYKVKGEADSAAYRTKIEDFFRSVLYLRLGPGANIILILTRWHDKDIAGTLLREEQELDPQLRSWHHINIPAVAVQGVPDALGRQPGEYLLSARGRTPQEFDTTRRRVGERTWWAMYQGVPRPLEGSLFKTAWFEDAVLDIEPASFGGVVGVDPAETAASDEAGIIAACRIGGVPVITHDWSGLYTSNQWARKAVLLAAHTRAREIQYEGYTAHVTYGEVLRTAVKRLVAEAKAAPNHIVEGIDCSALAGGVTPRVRHWRVKGDAVMRSSKLRDAMEAGTVRLSPGLDKLVDNAISWQLGQHCPDNVSAAVIAYDAMTNRSGTADVAAPGARPITQGGRTGAWAKQLG